MKILVKNLVVLMLLMRSASAWAHGEAAPAGVGPGKGVEFYDEHEGFILSKEAIRNFEMKSEKVQAGSKCDLRRAEKVQVLNEKKIYRIRDSKIQSVELQCDEFKPGDEVVVHGASFLRVVEMDLQSSEGEHEDEGEGEHHD